jgi:hypothetical protein
MMTSETRPGSMPGPLQRRPDGDRAEVVRRGGGERAVETADRGAGGADDDDIV